MWTKKDAMAIIFISLICAGVLLCAAIIDTAYGGPLTLSIIAVILSAVAIGIAAVTFDSMEET